MTPRPVFAEDLAPLAVLWERRWHEAHRAITPPGLLAARTSEDFATRLKGFGADLWVLGPAGQPRGFVAVMGHHVDQLYVDAALTGTGAAQALLAHAESVLAERGHKRAELYCAVENYRAAAFYRKAGWREVAEEEVLLASTSGPIPLICKIFSKDIRST